MGMESSDQVVIHSSIALLQERFKRLRRVKEMRQRKEMLRKLWESENYSNHSSNNPTETTHFKPSTKCFFEKDQTVLNPPPRHSVSLSLWPSSEIKHNSFRGVDIKPELVKSWLTDKPSLRAPPSRFKGSDSEVDTSLHL
ncbi:uncharacterized protein LOC131313972 [Rhododendron vialii]|uniref:uncharacterized protein LOC131313972 n=1 Tax=Rhododendron vialii TaxID=182163 RepID=UPI00265F89B8|nr:uncharacterized protein LOC131313972 [Rhododendron vialii]